MSKSVTLAGRGNITLAHANHKNYIINGNFDIWQRGTSVGSLSSINQFLSDRWHNYSYISSMAISRQSFATGQTDVPNNPKYYHRVVVTSGNTSLSASQLFQPIENVRTLAGRTVTVSFWAKADSSKFLSVELAQSFGSGGSPSASVVAIGTTKFSLTTAWTKYTVTTSIPSLSGKTIGTDNGDCLVLVFWFDADVNATPSRHGSIGYQSGTFDIAQVQLEEGSVATGFEYRTLEEEEELCYRYYQNIYRPATDFPIALTYVPNGDTRGGFPLLKEMRKVPTVNFSPTSWTTIVAGDASSAINVSPTIAYDVNSSTERQIRYYVTNPSVFNTASTTVVSWGTNTSVTITADAEL